MEEFAAAEQAHSGWAPAECSVALSPDGSFPSECSVALSPDDSFPAECSAAQGERHCLLDARPAYWPLAELGHDWLEEYKAPLPLWPVRQRRR